MEPWHDKQRLKLENVWKKDISEIRTQVLEIWRNNAGPIGERANERLSELVFVVSTTSGEVVGISTAFKAYVKRLRNHFYALRLLLLPQYRIPGLTSKLLTETCVFLESVHGQGEEEETIGVITLVENERLKQKRNEAVWPASKMVYIGNSHDGHHLRVYYFAGARIKP